MSEPCEAVSVMLGTPCGQPSAGFYAGACVHEHVKERWLCSTHAAPPEPLWCRYCYDIDGPVGHECAVTLTLVAERTAEAHAAQAEAGHE